MRGEPLLRSRLSALAADSAALGLTWVGVVELRGLLVSPALPPLPPEILLPIVGLIVPLGIAALASAGAYSRPRSSPAEVVRGVGLTLLGALLLLFLIRIPVNRTVLIGFAVCAVPALLAGRLLRDRVLRLGADGVHRILVVGGEVPSRALVGHLRGRPELRVVGVVGPEQVPDLAARLSADPADEVHVAGVLSTELLGRIAEVCDDLGLPLSVDANFLGLRTSAVELHDVDGWTAITFRHGSDASFERLVKRAVDVIGGGLGLVLLAPVIALLGLAVRVHDGGPALFHQQRIGRFGRPFTIHKLRSMAVHAESQPLVGTPDRASAPTRIKPKHDPRITRLGRILRRLSLDELPQLWNVVRGEMSLVGPRPPLPSEVERYERWQWRRLSVRPGMTGLWQVSGRADLPPERWVELDLQYVDGWSLWLDARVLVRTVPAVISGTGAR